MNWREILEILDSRFPRWIPESGVKPNHGDATGYVAKNGRQFAVETTSDVQRSNIWIEDVGPPVVPSHFQLYKEDKGRLSSLASVAPRLTGPGYGKPAHRAYKVVIASKGELESLLAWYANTDASTSELVEQSTTPPERLHPKKTSMKNKAQNIILYGPPGTGKTFSTTREAVKLCDGEVPSEDEAEIRMRFDALRREGRISFVTFHQSYGYEEFVEGIRPVSKEGQVVYEVQPGAFKRACHNAKLRAQINPGLSGRPLPERTFYKMSLGATWNKDGTTVFDHCITNNCVLLGHGGNVDYTDCADKDSILKKLVVEAPKIEKPESSGSYLHRFKHEIAIGDLIVVSNGNKYFRAIAEVTGDYEYIEDAPFHHMRGVRWLAILDDQYPTSELYGIGVIQGSLYKLKSDAMRFDKLEQILLEQAQSDPERPHVLIIDEINRANISKVFGELITLIEPDKREGEANAVTLKLPYSGEDFSVPSNLHILGTMNTADRSIALLDTALRRRFEFKELLPKPELLATVQIEGIDLARLLSAMNERVEALYDRDHTIGHAYLMGVTSLAELDRAFRLKVLPLLQEYFYENWSQVRRVLADVGDGDFVRRRVLAAVPVDGEQDFGEEPRVTYEVNREEFPVSAYLRIYGG